MHRETECIFIISVSGKEGKGRRTHPPNMLSSVFNFEPTKVSSQLNFLIYKSMHRFNFQAVALEKITNSLIRAAPSLSKITGFDRPQWPDMMIDFERETDDF